MKEKHPDLSESEIKEKIEFKKVSKPDGKRVKTYKTADNNFYEWVKFQRYAEENL